MRGMLCRGRGGSTDEQAGERVYGIHLRAPYQLRSADDLKYPFSNYVRGYTGLLDYIWYEPEQLEVQVSSTVCHPAFLPSSCPQTSLACDCLHSHL